MDDRIVDPIHDYEDIEAPLGTGPHKVRSLETLWPWDVYVCDRCERKAWFRTDGYDRLACSGEPDVDPDSESTAERDVRGD